MRRFLTMTAALAAFVAVTAPADATHRYAPPRDGLAFGSYEMVVHDAPSEAEWGGSWAWTWLGYHPNGWQVMAKSPSRAALTIRSLAVGDKIVLSGFASGAFTVTDTNARVYAWTQVGEDDVVFSVERPEGASYKVVAVNDDPIG